MEWLNEPASWQRTGDVLTVSVDPGTDFWRETGYGYIRDSGHVYGEVLAGDLDVSVRVQCILGAQYDQAGVMLRADERTWLKTGVEFFEGRPRLSTVLTLGRSSWTVTDLPAGIDDIVLRVSRRGDAVEVRYIIQDGPAELAALVFLPPGRDVLAGVMGAAPEGPGFRVTFQNLRITDRDWSGPAGDGAAGWQDDQTGWAGEETPAWRPAAAPSWSPGESEPGWPVPAAGDDGPDWPAEVAADEAPSWPMPPAREDVPDWPGPAAAEDGTDWPGPAAGEDEPDWPVPAEDAAGPEPERASAAEPAPDEPAGHDDAGHDAAGADPAGTEPARPGAAAAEHEPDWPVPAEDAARPEPERASAAKAESVGPEPAGPEPAGLEPAGPKPARPAARDRGTWSSAPPRGPGDWAVTADRDAAADWERLAAGAQAGPAQPWIAQTDADVAIEWPGPPLRTAIRNGLLGTGAWSRPAGDPSVDDAQTDPGLPRPRPAEQAAPVLSGFPAGEPRQDETAGPDPAAAGDSTPRGSTPRDSAHGDRTPGDGTAKDSKAKDGAAGDGAAGDGAAEPGPPEPARESRGPGRSAPPWNSPPSPTRPTNGSACSPPTRWRSKPRAGGAARPVSP